MEFPIVAWLKDQANEAMDHAWKIGEKMTAHGLHPEMRVHPIVETGKHSVLDVLAEALEYERAGLEEYKATLKFVLADRPDDAALEDWVAGSSRPRPSTSRTRPRCSARCRPRGPSAIAVRSAN